MRVDRAPDKMTGIGTLGTIAPDWRSIFTTTTRLDVIDRSVEKTHIWLNELSEELATEDGHHAYRVLRAFCTRCATISR